MPAAAVVAASVISAAASSNAANKSSDAAKKASKNATQLSEMQFNRGIEEVSPFKDVGMQSLSGLSAVANQPQSQFSYREPGNFLNEYFQSPEFLALNNQSTDQILRNRSVTGGIRSGGANVDLANIAPTLGINALNRANQQDLQSFGVNQGAQNDSFNRLYALGSLGANVASGNQVAGANFASQAGANAISAAGAQGLAYQQQGQAISGLASDLSSAYLANRMGYFDQQNKGKI